MNYPVEPEGISRVEAADLAGKPMRSYDLVMAAFVTVLLLSNIIGASKLSSVGGYVFGAGIMFFPLSYVLGDVLTEVYGYARARRCVWVGFAALLFLALMAFIVVKLPPAPGWGGQAAYEEVFSGLWRLALASITAFWVGEFANSFVLARLKLLTQGRMLWSRTIGSTIVGQAFDSLIFYPLAFYGIWTSDQIVQVMITNWALKVGWEIILTPLTYAVVGALKRHEGLDIFDHGTNFTPFRARV